MDAVVLLRRFRLFVGIGLINISYYSSISFFPIYLSDNFKISLSLIGIILSISPLFIALSGFVGGRLADFYHHRALLKIALMLTFFSYIEMMFAKSLISFAIGNAILGMSRGLFDVVFKVYLLQDTYNKINNFGYRALAINIGAAVGPIIGFLLISINLKLIFISAALLNIVSIFLLYEKSFQALSKQNYSILKITTSHQYKPVLYVTIASAASLIIYAQIDSSVPLFIKTYQVGYGFYSLLLTINAVLVITLQAPLSMIMKRADKYGLLILALVLFVVSVGGIFLIKNVTVAILSMVIFSIAEVLAFQINYLVVDAITPTEKKGLYFGISNLDVFGLAADPALGCFVFDNFGNTSLFFVMFGMAVIAILLYSKCHKLSRLTNKKW